MAALTAPPPPDAAAQGIGEDWASGRGYVLDLAMVIGKIEGRKCARSTRGSDGPQAGDCSLGDSSFAGHTS